ncbi:MAG: helicase [Pseudomonadota bacterium]|nr:helicase [Pseudomonadota bacterium]
MSNGPTRVDPMRIPALIKEAVADALVGLTYSRVAGTGRGGRELFNGRPSDQLVSGFLLAPKKTLDTEDEVTSPIRITSQGLDFQLRHGRDTSIEVRLSFCVYIRVVPNEADAVAKKWAPQMRLTREARDRLHAETRALVETRGASGEASGAIWATARREVHERHGLPTALRTIGATLPEDAASQPDADVADLVEVAPGGVLPNSDDLFERCEIPDKWVRLDVTCPPFNIDVALEPAELVTFASEMGRIATQCAHERITEWAGSEEGGRSWGYHRGLKVLPSDYKNWSRVIQATRLAEGKLALPSPVIAFDISTARDWVDRTRLNVHIAVENASEVETSHNRRDTDTAIFDVKITASFARSDHASLRLGRIEGSYRYNRFLTYPAMGFNCAVQEAQISSSDNVITLETTWLPRYRQPRLAPATIAGLACRMRDLAAPEGLSTLAALPDAFEHWLLDVATHTDISRGLDSSDREGLSIERSRLADDLTRWRGELESIRSGVSVLEDSRAVWRSRGRQANAKAVPFEAWLAMNESMADLMRERFGHDNAEWRVFQLAFVLSTLSSVVTRIKEFADLYNAERDDAVSLLYFATGGGKSEAFFGLLVFTLFLDRLRNKLFGVSALMRYPLRLLTIQQAQRLAKALAHAERVRLHNSYGGEQFSIGFWVGATGSPNRRSDPRLRSVPSLEESAAQAPGDDDYRIAERAFRKLPSCPFCGSDTVLRKIGALDNALGHVCTASVCDSFLEGRKALPFWICDEDIYAFAPSVVLGTVDKLALIGHSARTIRRILGMLGVAPWQQIATGRLIVPEAKDLQRYPPEGVRAIAPACPDGVPLFHDPFPALLIQDEAHLLDESLGTFASLFESTFDAMLSDLAEFLGPTVARDRQGKVRRMKVIAASATVSRPERQLEHLFQRESPAIQIPYPGPDLYRSFYAGPQPRVPGDRETTNWADDPERFGAVARIYAAILTNGRPHTATSVAILSAFHVTVTRLWDALYQNSASARDEMAAALEVTPEVSQYRSALRSASDDELATLLDLHRVTLTYVTNKKGGDQILAAEAEESRKQHERDGLPLDIWEPKLITGAVDQGTIQKVVADVRQRPNPGEPFPPLASVVRSIVATSAVSHGIDVDEFNSMFFAGMPSDIAEYIQASSRVGRTHVGFCLLIPTPQRRRDRYIVEVFDMFHRFLERMVQPASIDRWAQKAVERVFPSVFQAYFCGVLSSSAQLIALKTGVAPTEYTVVGRLKQLLRDRPESKQRFLGFAQRAIGLTERYDPAARPFYENLLARLFNDLVSVWTEADAQSALSDYFGSLVDFRRKPMTSLRDVEEAGRIHVAGYDLNNRKMSQPAAVKAMALMRSGTVTDADDGDEDD